ncbi:MAG: 2-C-methyl-D-erythritol 2,4-cyclodiphosphate synthase [Bifidobacteriaceae bacterium]|jgi:2-C-methyl-D-erythritol 2,4-cyclodiphosphate synthase|nr:2-C-methyl-D-erythritol 2,4-cyclodiphosphate synthase [Bifidobacteriaceae bacterium]
MSLNLPANFRVGLGYDIHKFSNSTGSSGDFPISNFNSSNRVNPPCLWLLGLEWPDYAPLKAHSDGDCAIHALTDAILSAANLGDIGFFMGVDEPDAKNISGKDILIKLNKLLQDKNIELINASVLVICQKPKISERRKDAEKVLSEILQAPISVSATTTDGLGEIGQALAVASQSVALIKYI